MRGNSLGPHPPTIFFGRRPRARVLVHGPDLSSEASSWQARFFAQLGGNIGLEAFDLLDDVFLFVKDADRRFVYYNRAFRNLMALSSPSDLLGRRDEDISPEYLVEHYRAHDEEVLSGATLSDIVELVQNSSGSYDWCLTSKFPARGSDGRTIGVVGITQRLYAREHPESKFGGLAPAVELMLQDFQRPISVAEMAVTTCLSISQFARSFKQYFGVSPHQYLRQIRINAACELLAVSDHSLSEVASLTGFYDQSHMTNTFVKAKGISPRRYREQFGKACPIV